MAELPRLEHHGASVSQLTAGVEFESESGSHALVWVLQNNPNASTLYSLDANGPAITHNRSQPLSSPGYVLSLQWESPGVPVGPDDSYTTNTSALGPPAFVAWVSQLNTTYTALNVSGENAGTTVQPFDDAINGTMFVAVVDADIYLTPHNISMLNEHIVAGPAIYQAS